MSGGLAVHREQPQQRHQRPAIPDLTSSAEPRNRPQRHPLSPPNHPGHGWFPNLLWVLAYEHQMLGVDQTRHRLKSDQVPTRRARYPVESSNSRSAAPAGSSPSSTGPARNLPAPPVRHQPMPPHQQDRALLIN